LCLSTHVKGINFENGLEIWQDKAVYIKVLQGFIVKYHDIVEKLGDLIHDADITAGCELSMELKSVAGHLSIFEVEQLAIKIDHKLKSNCPKEAELFLTELSYALKTVKKSILQLQVPVDPGVPIAEKSDLEESFQIIDQMMFFLNRGELNDDLLEKITMKLSGHIAEGMLEVLVDAIEIYDFDDAIKQLKNIDFLLKIYETMSN